MSEQETYAISLLPGLELLLTQILAVANAVEAVEEPAMFAIPDS